MARITAVAFAASLALLAPAKAADAGSQGLSLGEIAVLAPAAAPMSGLFRTTLESEMQGLDLHASHKDAILSASLVKLDAEKQRSLESATCVVSITLRSRSGNLFAMLEGRAQAQGSSDHVPESALRGAVHGALTRVPEALR